MSRNRCNFVQSEFTFLNGRSKWERPIQGSKDVMHELAEIIS